MAKFSENFWKKAFGNFVAWLKVGLLRLVGASKKSVACLEFAFSRGGFEFEIIERQAIHMSAGFCKSREGFCVRCCTAKRVNT